MSLFVCLTRNRALYLLRLTDELVCLFVCLFDQESRALFTKLMGELVCLFVCLTRNRALYLLS